MALADYIRGRKTFRTSRVEHAFQTVPRHVFLPGVDLEAAYAPPPVVTKRADDGTAVSSAPSPNLVAGMLELLDVQLGHRILEIGAATGINAALLAELTGPTGQVVTIELDDDLAAGARASLTAAGYHQVQGICGDGALGHATSAPYDRIIVTAGAWDIAPAWWQQLAIGGRLVVPLRLHGSGLTRVLAFDLHQPDLLISTSAQVCGFVPMRGTVEQAEHHVRLDDDVVLKLDTADLPDEAALAHALTHPAYEHWTGMQVHDEEPAQHLDLWLTTTNSPSSFGRSPSGLRHAPAASSTQHCGGRARPCTTAAPSPTLPCSRAAMTRTSWASSPTAPTARNSPTRPATCCTAGTGNDPASPPSPLVPPDRLRARLRPQHTSTDHTPGWPSPADQRGVVVPCRGFK
jgi:methyltransferase of FxLD system